MRMRMVEDGKAAKRWVEGRGGETGEEGERGEGGEGREEEGRM